MKDITTVVSFANVPVPEIGRLAKALVDAGYVWRFNSSGWETAFTKTIPSDSLLDELENEVREIMGDYYAEPGARTTKPDEWSNTKGRPLGRPSWAIVGPT